MSDLIGRTRTCDGCYIFASTAKVCFAELRNPQPHEACFPKFGLIKRHNDTPDSVFVAFNTIILYSCKETGKNGSTGKDQS